ncbi:hypothetical protein F66182_8713 [Fusarium sp. NRRL 66182]|nr:hypothetical protein F66182_8713 [Fusarium sp. NRRL 66182]
MASLADRIGSESLRGLVADLDGLIKRRVCQKQTSQAEGINFRTIRPLHIEPRMAKKCIQAFFTNIHPVYPFIDRAEFVAQATDAHLDGLLQINPPFSALYHAVLALGSQYLHFGSFVPHNGQAWEMFQVSLGKMSEILAPPVGLMNLQALTAMSIFAMSPCCLQLDQTLISEAARMAQTLRYHKSSNADASQLRTFWTVYLIEKLAAFSECQSSILADEDIGCTIPIAPESVFGDYDWFTSAIRLARISSIAYTDLFSASASSKSKTALATGIRRIRQLLGNWQVSLPPSLRPGEAIRHSDMPPSMKLVLLQTQYAYYNIIFAVERLTLHVFRDEANICEESNMSLISASRTVAELILFIDIEPHVPIL